MSNDLLNKQLSIRKPKPKRESVARSQKNEVLSKQKNKCAGCGKMIDMTAVNFDHIKEVYKGGKSRVRNLQALCLNCHGKKTHKDRLKKTERGKAKPKKSAIDKVIGL